MAVIKQSEWATGQRTTAVAGCAGVVVCERFEYTISANITAATDIIELGVLPAGAQVVEAILDVAETGTATYDVGIMSGSVGSTASDRTSGNEYFAAAADNGVTRMTKQAGFAVAPTDNHRSIGVKVSADITASGQLLALNLFYKQ